MSAIVQSAAASKESDVTHSDNATKQGVHCVSTTMKSLVPNKAAKSNGVVEIKWDDDTENQSDTSCKHEVKVTAAVAKPSNVDYVKPGSTKAIKKNGVVEINWDDDSGSQSTAASTNGYAIQSTSVPGGYPINHENPSEGSQGHKVVEIKWDDDESFSSCGNDNVSQHVRAPAMDAMKIKSPRKAIKSNGVVVVNWDDDSDHQSISSFGSSKHHEAQASAEVAAKEKPSRDTELQHLHLRLLACKLTRKESTHTISSMVSEHCDSIEEHSEQESSNNSFGNDDKESAKIEPQQHSSAESAAPADAITSNTMKLLTAVDRIQQRRIKSLSLAEMDPSEAISCSPSDIDKKEVPVVANEDMESRLMNCLLRSKTASSCAPASVAIGGEYKLGYSQQPSTRSMGCRRGRRASMNSSTTSDMVAATFSGRGGRRRGSLDMRSSSMEISLSGDGSNTGQNEDNVQKAFERLRFRADRLERVRRRNSLTHAIPSQSSETNRIVSFSEHHRTNEKHGRDQPNDNENDIKPTDDMSKENQEWNVYPRSDDNNIGRTSGRNENQAFSVRNQKGLSFAKEEISFSPTGKLDWSTNHTNQTLDKDPYAVTFANKSFRRASLSGPTSSSRIFKNGIPSVIYEPQTPYDDDTSTCISSVISKSEKLQKSSFNESLTSVEYARTPPTKSLSLRKKTFSVPQIHVHNDSGGDSKMTAANTATKEAQGEITFVPSNEENAKNAVEKGGDRHQVPVFGRRSPLTKNSSRCFTVSEQDELLCSKIFKQSEQSPAAPSRENSRSISNHSIDICFVPFTSASENEDSKVNGINQGGDDDCPKRKLLSDSSDSTLSRSRRILNDSASKLETVT